MANYSTGTVATAGTTTLTGTGTLWQTAGVKKGMPVAIKFASGENVYYVSSVTSETVIVLTGAVSEADASGLSYTICMEFGVVGEPVVGANDAAWPSLLRLSNEILGREVLRRQFRASLAYEFDDSADGWTGTNATLETNSDDANIPMSAVQYTVTAGSHYMALGSLTINADIFDRLEIRARYVSGTADGIWSLAFNAGGWQAHNHYRDLLRTDGEWRWVSMDLSSDANWTGTVTDLRITPPSNADNDLVVQIDVVAIGKDGVSTLLATAGSGALVVRETPSATGDTFELDYGYSNILLVQFKDGSPVTANVTYSDAAAGEFTALDGVGAAIPGAMAGDLRVTYWRL